MQLVMTKELAKELSEYLGDCPSTKSEIGEIVLLLYKALGDGESVALAMAPQSFIGEGIKRYAVRQSGQHGLLPGEVHSSEPRSDGISSQDQTPDQCPDGDSA